jgi:prepilin-type N-terminal cleavage/methylation domain-containing protein
MYLGKAAWFEKTWAKLELFGDFMNCRAFTILEILIVTTIIGIIAGIGFISGRQIAQRQDQNASLRSIQQLFWQGATGAASRGVEVTLERNDNVFTLERADNNEVIRSYTLPNQVSINFPEGEVVRFTPPGKIDDDSYDALPSPITLSTEANNYTVIISTIGEVRLEGSE